MKRYLVVTVESFVLSFIIYFVFFNMTLLKSDFLNMNIHPLAVLVAFMALRYGVYLNLITFFWASFFYIMAFIKLEKAPLGFFSSYHNYKYILIFFFISLFLGRFSDNKNEEINDIKEEKEAAEKEYDAQRKNALKLVEMNEHLKNRILTKRESIITLNSIMVKMEGMSFDDLYTEICNLIMKFVSCDVFSIYRYNKEKNFIHSKIKIGNSRIPECVTLDADSPFTKVLNSKDVVEVKNYQESGHPVFISPIVKDGEVIGFLNVERILYKNRDDYLFEMFKILSTWLNKPLVTAFKKEKTAHKRSVFPGTNIVNLSFFDESLNSEQKRKHLLNTDFVLFEAENPGYSPKEVEEALNLSVSHTDLIGMNENIIKILFYNTDISNRDFLMEKVKNKLARVDFYEI